MEQHSEKLPIRLGRLYRTLNSDIACFKKDDIFIVQRTSDPGVDYVYFIVSEDLKSAKFKAAVVETEMLKILHRVVFRPLHVEGIEDKIDRRILEDNCWTLLPDDERLIESVEVVKEKINGTDLFFDTQYKITDFQDEFDDKDLHLEIGDVLYMTRYVKGNKVICKIWNGLVDIYQFDSITALCKTLELFELQEINPQPCDENPYGLAGVKEEFPDETECEDKSSEKDEDNLVDAPVFVPEVKINIGNFNNFQNITIRYYVKSEDVFSKESYEFSYSQKESNSIPRIGETIKFEVLTEKQPRPNCKRGFAKRIIEAEVTMVVWDLSGGEVSIEAKF